MPKCISSGKRDLNQGRGRTGGRASRSSDYTGSPKFMICYGSKVQVRTQIQTKETLVSLRPFQCSLCTLGVSPVPYMATGLALFPAKRAGEAWLGTKPWITPKCSLVSLRRSSSDMCHRGTVIKNNRLYILSLGG